MIGTIYSVSSGSAHRVGVVPIAGDEPKGMRELASFLFSPSKPAPSAIALTAPPWEARESDATAPALGIRYPLGWALSGGAIAAGAAMIATDSNSAQRSYVGYALVGAGLVGGITTTIFYLRRGNTTPRPMTTIMLAPTRAGLFAGVGRRF